MPRRSMRAYFGLRYPRPAAMDLHRFIDREGGDLATSATQSFFLAFRMHSLDLKEKAARALLKSRFR